MEQKQIDRLNQLSRVARERPLTPEESAEREHLRRAYIDAVKQSLQAQLDNTYYLDGQGNRVPLSRRKEQAGQTGADGQARPGKPEK